MDLLQRRISFMCLHLRRWDYTYGGETVSYTHLDVYERQELTRGMTKRETEALRKNLDKILNNIADP